MKTMWYLALHLFLNYSSAPFSPSVYKIVFLPLNYPQDNASGFPHGSVGKESACNAGDTVDVAGTIKGCWPQKCPYRWVAVNFNKWKIHVESTDCLHVGLSGSLTEHDMAFWSSSSWPNQLSFCNCSFSLGIIKTQPK